jgi:hypothetical protein
MFLLIGGSDGDRGSNRGCKKGTGFTLKLMCGFNQQLMLDHQSE